MHRHAASVTAAALLAVVAVGCAAPTTAAGSGGERSLAPVATPADTTRHRPASDGAHGGAARFGAPAAAPAQPRPDGSVRDVGSVAAREIIRRLDDESLLVLTLASEVEEYRPRRATVVVTVLYGTGDSHPIDAAYRLHLDRHGPGWQVVDVATVP